MVQVVIKDTSEQAKRHQTKSKLIPNEIRDTLLSLYILCGILALYLYKMFMDTLLC